MEVMGVLEEVGRNLWLAYGHDVGVLGRDATLTLVAVTAYIDLRRVGIHCKSVRGQESDRHASILRHHSHPRLGRDQLKLLVIGDKHAGVRLMPLKLLHHAVLLSELQMLLPRQFTSTARTRRRPRRIIRDRVVHAARPRRPKLHPIRRLNIPLGHQCINRRHRQT